MINTLEEALGKIPAGVDKFLWMERNRSLINATAMKSMIKIVECREKLIALPSEFLRFDPHVYVSKGAPYGDASPFHLRSGIVKKLEEARAYLQEERPGYNFKIFDGYRPLGVQEYMVDLTFHDLVKKAGLKVSDLSEEEKQGFYKEVFNLFARPNRNPNLPPPHSTGSAVDLTIVDENGKLIPMGSEIDSMPPEALPNFFLDQKGKEEFHNNRILLNRVMEKAGFKRLWFEWWHFSFGDQFWGLAKALELDGDIKAIYGAVELM